jgi:lipopolysaccharide cholinephosphotransferase
MPKNIYKNKVKVEFEGYKFWAPDGYDYYLKSLYGNYMELPPIDKRISHHDFKAYWKEEKDI